jgi:hypothetical protein
MKYTSEAEVDISWYLFPRRFIVFWNAKRERPETQEE